MEEAPEKGQTASNIPGFGRPSPGFGVSKDTLSTGRPADRPTNQLADVGGDDGRRSTTVDDGLRRRPTDRPVVLKRRAASLEPLVGLLHAGSASPSLRRVVIDVLGGLCAASPQFKDGAWCANGRFANGVVSKFACVRRSGVCCVECSWGSRPCWTFRLGTCHQQNTGAFMVAEGAPQATAAMYLQHLWYRSLSPSLSFSVCFLRLPSHACVHTPPGLPPFSSVAVVRDSKCGFLLHSPESGSVVAELGGCAQFERVVGSGP